jgi:RNA polymerase sigma-70 factor (ECF subfamily)
MIQETELHRRFLPRFALCESALRSFIRRLVPAPSDADDVMQEVCVVLWEKFGSFDEKADFRAWAFGVARFEVLAWLRDKGRDRLVLDEEVVLQLAEEAESFEPALCRQREALEGCIQKVPPEQRSLLIQAYQTETQIHQVARQSGRTVPGFYQWLHRIRKMLLDCIQTTLRKEFAL